MYQDFDWEYAKSRTNPIKYNYLKNYWDKEISEEQFVKDWKLFKPFSSIQKDVKKPNMGASRRLHRGYSEGNLKYRYKRLKIKFGFFIGNKN